MRGNDLRTGIGAARDLLRDHGLGLRAKDTFLAARFAGVLASEIVLRTQDKSMASFPAARTIGAGFLFLATQSGPAKAETLTMWIGPNKRPCTAGVMPTQCTLVKWRADQKDWENFYSRIDGFEPRAGYSYKIVVRRSAIVNPPADGGSFRYELLKVVSRKTG